MKSFLFRRRFSYFDCTYILASAVLVDKNLALALWLLLLGTVVSLIVDYELEKK